MPAPPRPEVKALVVFPTDKGCLEDNKAMTCAKVTRDGVTWAWRGDGKTVEAALRNLIVAILDDPHTAEFVREG